MNIRKPIKKTLYFLHKNPLSNYLYQKEIQKRSILGITNIEALSKHIDLFFPYSKELNPSNDWYGHAKIFKKFLGLPEEYQFKFIIEHGLHLIDKVLNPELEINLPSFITYSNYRVNIIKRYRKHAFCIGPYIHYAPHYLTKEQLSEEKRKLGKCLLLFPSHSTGDINMEYDIKWLCRKVKEIANSYRTVRVCLYWKDVLRGHAKYYKNYGFECITAGHILDPLFLPRLKSIIETATLTISNDLGNHVGYSIFMNKPHFIIEQDQTFKGRKSEKIQATRLRRSNLYNLILQEFTKMTFTITKKQRDLVNYYWGINNIKTKEEFIKIINNTENIYQHKI